MSPAKARPGRGLGKKKPQNFTGDRLDSVLAGQFVQPEVPSLDSTPDDGWFEVKSVSVAGGLVTLTFTDQTTFVAPPDRLVRVGWS